jgi:hypothetical protein
MRDGRPVVLAIAAVLSIGVLVAAGCGQGSATATADGPALIAERCTRCHTRTRIDDARHDRAGWEATVARMRGKGAQLSDGEAVIVVDYLAGRQVP